MRIADYDLTAAIRTPIGVRYEATHRFLPRRAVIELRDARTGTRTEAIRLLKQACLLDALHHPAIPRVFECGMHEGSPWVAFERIEAVPLEVELRAGALDIDDVLEILDGVSGALAHAHPRGVLHRDITPASIHVRAVGRSCPIVLSGWTTACTVDAELRTPVRGPMRFRAPEMLEDDLIDGRADVFSLGAVVKEILAGSGDAHADLAPLLARMTATERFERPTAAEVRAEVRALRAARAAEPAEPAAPPAVETVAVPERTRPLRWTPQVEPAAKPAPTTSRGPRTRPRG